MWKSALVVAVVLLLLAALVHAFTRYRRRRALASMDESEMRLLARDVGIRGLLHGMPPWRGLDPRRTNKTRGDLALSDHRFLLVSARGVLLDERLGDRGFTSVRCTGPGRLVIEGDVPQASGRAGVYRFEIAVEQAEAWADALTPFVRESTDARRFGSGPPPWASR